MVIDNCCIDCYGLSAIMSLRRRMQKLITNKLNADKKYHFIVASSYSEECSKIAQLDNANEAQLSSITVFRLYGNEEN